MSIECSKAVQGFLSKSPHCWGLCSCLLDLEWTIGPVVLALTPPLHHLVFLSPKENPPKDSQLVTISNQTINFWLKLIPGYISPFMGIFQLVLRANSQNHNVATLYIGNCHRKNSSNHGITIITVGGQIYPTPPTIPLHCLQLHTLAQIQAAANQKVPQIPRVSKSLRRQLIPEDPTVFPPHHGISRIVQGS